MIYLRSGLLPKRSMKKLFTVFVISLIVLSLTPSSIFAAITGPSATVSVGSTLQLISSVDSGGWGSSNPSAATVSQTGLVTGVSAGYTVISYSSPYGLSTYNVTVVGSAPPPDPQYPVYSPGGTLLGYAPKYNGTAITSSDWTYARSYGAGNIVLDGKGPYACATYAWGMAQNPGLRTSFYQNEMLQDGSYSYGAASNHAIVYYNGTHWAIKATEVKKFNPSYLAGYSTYQLGDLYISKWNDNGPLVMHQLQDCPFYPADLQYFK